MLKNRTRPGQATLKKCEVCGQWRGILTFVDDHQRHRKLCKKCREHKKG